MLRVPTGCSDGGRFLLAGRLGEPLAQGAELAEFRLPELGVPIRQIHQRLVEPLLLIVGMTPDDATLHHLLKQLIPGFLER